MVAGWFTWVKNPVIHVQAYTQLGCMPASIPNTCIRAVVVQITPPRTNERLVVSWGSWPPERSVQNIVINDSTGASINVAPNAYKSKTYLNGKYQISKNGGTLSIRPVGAAVSDPALAVSVSIAEYMVAVTLPNAPPHAGQSNGLMGFFNGYGTKAYAKVFRNRDGTASAITTKSLCQGGVGACGWGSQQKLEIINWAVTHVVTAANGVNPPIAFSNKPNLAQQAYRDGWKVSRTGRRLLGVSDFSPVPVAMEPIVLPSYVPKVSKADIAFCKNLLRGKVSKKKRQSQMKSCLQDASSPTVARSIAKVNVVARKQQRRAKRALVKAVRKNKEHSIKRLRILYKSIQKLMKLYDQ